MRIRRFIMGAITAALMLPGAGSMAQDGRTVITPENAGALTQLARLGRGSAESVAFSPDGATLAVAGSVGVWLYDADALDTPDEPPLLISDGESTSVLFSPDGSTLAAAGMYGDILLWDMETQAETAFEKATYGTARIAFSADGETLINLIGSRGVALIDRATGTETLLEGNFHSESGIAISPDGRWLAAVGTDSTIYLWDLTTNEAGVTLTGHTSTPVRLAFGPDNLLLSGAADRTVRLWDVAEGTEIAQVTARTAPGRIQAVAFSPDGESFAAGDMDSNLYIWDTASQAETLWLDLDASIDHLAFSPDGTRIATITSRQAVTLWDTTDGAEIATAVGHTDIMNAVAFSPDSGTLAISDYDSNLWLWDTAAMPELNHAALVPAGGTTSSENLTAIDFSSDGRLIATRGSFAINLFDGGSHALVRKIEGVGIVESLVFSPDDALIAAISSSGLYVFNVASGELLASHEETNDWPNSVAWSPDQTLIAVSSNDNTTRVYGLQP